MSLTSFKKKHKLLELDGIISLDLCKLSYKYMTKDLPQPIYDLFPPCNEHQYRTRNRQNPNIGLHKTCIYSNSFLTATNREWRKVDQNIKNAKTLKSFNYKFKEIYC